MIKENNFEKGLTMGLLYLAILAGIPPVFTITINCVRAKLPKKRPFPFFQLLSFLFHMDIFVHATVKGSSFIPRVGRWEGHLSTDPHAASPLLL